MADYLMQMPGKLVFTAEGRWTHDGVEVTHENIRDYFSSHLKFSEEHQNYVISVDGRCVLVDVEDTAVMVRTIDTTTQPWLLMLSSSKSETFRPESLEATADGRIYCRIYNGAEKARLLSPACQALAPFLEESRSGYVLQLGEKQYAIRSCST